MTFTDTLEGDVAVFALSGRIMGGPSTTLFHGRICEHINRGKHKIVVDLGKVEWINSVGLGMLISARETTRRAGGELTLANITNIRSILATTRLLTIFQHRDSRREAIASLSQPPTIN